MPRKAKIGTATITSEIKPTHKLRATKYKAIPTLVDGIRFDSMKEAARYRTLKALLERGEISNLVLQVPFDLVLKCKYVADFEYTTKDGKRVVEDVKGYKTAEYKRKRKLMRVQHGIEILET